MNDEMAAATKRAEKVIIGYLINTFNAAIFSASLNLLKIDVNSKEGINAVF